MNVLIIDNNMDQDCWGSPELRRYASSLQGVTVSTRRGPHEDLPRSLKKFDKIIISGSRASCLDESPWIAGLDQLIREAINHSKPLLGVCFGHQALNRVIGGRELLRTGANAEFGWTKIEKVGHAPLLEGLPDSFYSFSAHFEEVHTPPKGMRVLARSEDCEIQACQFENLPIYGVQFHPERNLVEGTRTLIYRKKLGVPSTLLNADVGHKLYDPKVGDLIFKNFLSE